MAPDVNPKEPQSAAEYDDRTTVAVKAVLIEIGQILGSFKGTGGPEALAEASRPLLAHASGERGYLHIADKFSTVDSYGPTCVRKFVEDTQILGTRTPDQWQQDAFGQVNAWLVALGLSRWL